MSPSGNRSKLVSHLKRQAIDWAGKIRLGRASQDEAWTALRSSIEVPTTMLYSVRERMQVDHVPGSTCCTWQSRNGK